MAFWFTSPNGRLNGGKPVECLIEIDAEVGAAADGAEPIADDKAAASRPGINK
jgi:hypothetical protein